MSSAIDRFDERARRAFDGIGRTVLGPNEIVRHSRYTRFLHWSYAAFFFLALFSGFAVYSPWLFHWLAPLFGGGAMARFLHPWFGVLFCIFFVFQIFNWLGEMKWTPTDTRFFRDIKGYITNEELLAPEDTGFFNGGQKFLFWLIVASLVLFVVTGTVMWFDNVIPRAAVAISYMVHDVAALLMLGGIIIHIYQSTAQEPGTFGSMISGTVTREWARTHYPGWYRKVTGGSARED